MKNLDYIVAIWIELRLTEPNWRWYSEFKDGPYAEIWAHWFQDFLE